MWKELDCLSTKPLLVHFWGILIFLQTTSHCCCFELSVELGVFKDPNYLKIWSKLSDLTHQEVLSPCSINLITFNICYQNLIIRNLIHNRHESISESILEMNLYYIAWFTIDSRFDSLFRIHAILETIMSDIFDYFFLPFFS